ncbi:hypothetical protein [Undibacterium macrobrachii]|jgi:hypothetical protein|uniref:Uncharacterized protein n=1 Tax=Undibacterium macrobrachii TaxID=1119058 RepID=A0ABQ2XC68_9BURK|nr:hypothetical protein [Undibacterium macrobrachii]GGX10105.1 hypothetical protein GCM10011282_15490 [Undibacterium macrobrachii]
MTSNKDNGDWLSAQQAVQADGSERHNLPLINKKLPPLVANPEENANDAITSADKSTNGAANGTLIKSDKDKS